MVGASLALQLAAAAPGHVDLPGGGLCATRAAGRGKPDYHPSFDARSTALSYSTRLIFEKIGFWDDLQQWLCPIDTIPCPVAAVLAARCCAADYGWSALGYVVENAWLGNALIQALYRQQRVEIISPARWSRPRQATGMRLHQLEGPQAALKPPAAGRGRGRLRPARESRCSRPEKPYRQHAMVANIAYAVP